MASLSTPVVVKNYCSCLGQSLRHWLWLAVFMLSRLSIVVLSKLSKGTGSGVLADSFRLLNTHCDVLCADLGIFLYFNGL